MVRLENRSVVIDGKPSFIFSGELQYCRLSHEEWVDRLEKIKALGLNAVGAYFPWNYHATDEHTVDFSSADHDIAQFLRACHDVGLHVIARPGPFICNEWDLGGYPAWLMEVSSGDWRSADPVHISWARTWYHQVNAILKDAQYGRGGSIILYQIENEFRWNDRVFLDALADAAIADGIAVPIIGNHDGAAIISGSKVVDGMDIYTDVYEWWRWRGFFDGMRRRVPANYPLMVVEYRAATIALWGDRLASGEALPPDWVATQDRMFLGKGANVLNHFVVAGGRTPINFGSDHITTGYGIDAAIAPWGGLNPAFYEIRLVAELIRSLNEELAVSEPWDIGWGDR